MGKKNNSVPTGKWYAACRFCPNLKVLKSSRLSAEKFRDVHNSVVHGGRVVAYVEEFFV